MNEKLVPAMGAAVAVARASLLAGAAATVSPAVPERELGISAAVRLCGPALISVAEKVPCPLVNVESGGRITPDETSLLLKWTLPL